jgi:hypothetical protein
MACLSPLSLQRDAAAAALAFLQQHPLYQQQQQQQAPLQQVVDACTANQVGTH